MARAEIEISNKLGLHARASAKLTQLAGSFDSDVWLEKAGRRINAKSIMGMMSMALLNGEEVVIDAEGEDEEAAAAAIEEFLTK